MINSVTDNMKTVIDEARTDYQLGKVNTKFDQFAKDFGFKVRTCIAGRPRTKGKIEATMKFLDEIHAYQGQLTLEELHHLSCTLPIASKVSVRRGSKVFCDFERLK